MKLPSLTAFQQKETNKAFEIRVSVQAANDKEAVEMQDAIQSFVSHFTVAEMKSAAHKLKSVTNRKMIKTFL
ncbi:MAG: hypothetical protein BGO69_12615 [Bacteroidetes bacterium 46-16]|nr:MAG: hypothetical protein BGO69_12615 [Bacteroidetes bacterium 46-16]